MHREIFRRLFLFRLAGVSWLGVMMGVSGDWRCNAFVNLHRDFFCFVIFRSRVEDWIVFVVVVASLNYIFPVVVLVLAVGLDSVVVLIVAASLDWVVLALGLDCVVVLIVVVGLDWVVVVVGLDCIFRVLVASLGWTVKYGFCELEHLGVVLIGPSNPFGHRCGTLI